MFAMDKRWIYGGPRDIWTRYRDIFKQFVEKEGLKPVRAEELAKKAGAAQQVAYWSPPQGPLGWQPVIFQPPIGWPRKPPFPGFPPDFHIHLDDRVYIVNEKQWGKMAAAILADVNKRIVAAKAVPEMADIIDIEEAVTQCEGSGR